MSFDIAVHDEAQLTRVAVTGRVTLGQLASLMQVLQVDSRAWPHEFVLLDFSGIEDRFPATEKELLGHVARCRLLGRRVTVRWPADAPHA
ncbi:MAG: hypothetical protein EOO30_05895 [Comamonadaceae bacterium]|nr:MAG: hypothetical protein EOO30_05895 [Comamonadaceae bacterium]